MDSPPYSVQVDKSAAKYFASPDPKTKERIRKRLEEFTVDPYGCSKALVNQSARSSRVGDWRILLTILETEKVVVVSRIAPRGEVYEK